MNIYIAVTIKRIKETPKTFTRCLVLRQPARGRGNISGGRGRGEGGEFYFEHAKGIHQHSSNATAKCNAMCLYTLG